MASIIASQALISGAFSLTVQAMQLDYLPRLAVLHTSAHHMGPGVRAARELGADDRHASASCSGFQTSSNLAAAYGIAVTTTMVITSILFFVVARDRWGWSRARTTLVVTPLLVVDCAFLAANVPKIPDGGWFPLVVAVVLLVQMATWHKGRQLVAARIRRGERTVDQVLAEAHGLTRVDGYAVFLFKDPGQGATGADQQPAPQQGPARAHHPPRHRHHRCPPPARRRATGDHRVAPTRRVADRPAVRLHGGRPTCPRRCPPVAVDGQPLDLDEVTYFVGRESVYQGDLEGMHPALEHLYTLLHRGADSASRFFGLPRDRVFEVGAQVEL